MLLVNSILTGESQALKQSLKKVRCDTMAYNVPAGNKAINDDSM